MALVALVTAGIGTIPVDLLLGHRMPLYLIAVLASGALLGRGPAIAAAVLSFLAFNWFFTNPVHTLVVTDPNEWQALLLFLLTALVTGQLTALLRHRAAEAEQREREALALYEIGKALAGATSPEAALQAALERLRGRLALAVCDVLLPDGGYLRPLRGGMLDGNEQAMASWVFQHGQPASRGWSRRRHRLVRIRASRGAGAAAGPRRPSGAAFFPLIFEGRTVGVLHVAGGAGRPLDAAEARFLSAASDQLALGVERDRLQRESVAAEVRAQLLEQTDQLRAALLSSVSHDLRTPLAAIKAAAGSLLQREIAWDEGARLAFAAQIEREADRLNRLVGNLLDLSRIEAGALVLDRQWYPLAALVDDTVARLSDVLAGHRVETAIPGTLPPVPLDYVLMQQVLTNLLENAATYAPPGTRICITAARDENSVRLCVEDEGPGLPAEDRERVFQPFYRVTRGKGSAGANGQAPSAAKRGTGLGLAVCAGFVAAHGGRIWVEAAQPGAAFVVELPLGAMPAAPAPKVARV